MAGEGPPGKFTKATLRQTPLPVLEEFSYRELQYSCSYSKQLQNFILSGVRLFSLEELPEEYASENGFGSKFTKYQWLDLIWKFLIIVIILSCAILMSVLGILWCVFRKKFSKKVRESNIRIRKKIRLCVTLLLLLLTLGLIVALVMAYKMNEMFGDVSRPRSRFVSGLNMKARAQFDGITRQITTLLSDNFRELKMYLSDYLQTTVRDMLEVLKINGRLNYFGELVDYRNQMDELLINTMRFVDDVRFFARNMTVALDKTKWGREIYTNTRLKYFQDTTIKMDELARLDGMLESLESIIKSLKTIHQEVETMLSESRMEKVVQQINQPILNHLEEQELQLNRFEQEVNRKLRSGMDGLESGTHIGSVAAAYRLGLLFCFIITLIAAGLLCSVAIGLCKEFGVARTVDDKVPAVRCLAATTWMIFLTIFAIAIICSYYFVLGMVVHSGLCKSSFSSTQRSSRKSESPASLLIRHCKQKETAYVSLLNDKLLDKLNISLFPSAALEQLECPFCGFAATNNIFTSRTLAKFVERASQISSLQATDYGWLRNELHLDQINEVYQQLQDNRDVFDDDDHRNMSCVLQYFKQEIDNIATVKILSGAESMAKLHKHLMTHFAPDIKTTIERYMANGLSRLFGHNFRTDKEPRKHHSPHELYSNTEAMFKNLMEDFKQKAEDYMFSKLKSCEPIVRPYRALRTGTCTCLHLGLNGFWIFAFIIFFLLLPICCLSAYLTELYPYCSPRKGPAAPLTVNKKKSPFKMFGCCQKKDSKARLLEDTNQENTTKSNPNTSFSKRIEKNYDPESLSSGPKCSCGVDTISSVFTDGPTTRPKSIMKVSETPVKDNSVKKKISKLLCCSKKTDPSEDKATAEKSSNKWLCCKKKTSKASVMDESSEKLRESAKRSSSVSFEQTCDEGNDKVGKTSKTWFCCKKKDSKASTADDTSERDTKKKTSKTWLCCKKTASKDGQKTGNAAKCCTGCTCNPSVQTQGRKLSKLLLCCKKKDSVKSANSTEDKSVRKKTSKMLSCCKKKASQTTLEDDCVEQEKKTPDNSSKKWSCCAKKPSKVTQSKCCVCSDRDLQNKLGEQSKVDQATITTQTEIVKEQFKETKERVEPGGSQLSEDDYDDQEKKKKKIPSKITQPDCCICRDCNLRNKLGKQSKVEEQLKEVHERVESGREEKKKPDKSAKKWSCCTKKPSKVTQSECCVCSDRDLRNNLGEQSKVERAVNKTQTKIVEEQFKETKERVDLGGSQLSEDDYDEQESKVTDKFVEKPRKLTQLESCTCPDCNLHSKVGVQSKVEEQLKWVHERVESDREEKKKPDKSAKKWTCCAKKPSKVTQSECCVCSDHDLRNKLGEQSKVEEQLKEVHERVESDREEKKKPDKSAKKWSCCTKKPSKVTQSECCVCSDHDLRNKLGEQSKVEQATITTQTKIVEEQFKEAQERVEPGGSQLSEDDYDDQEKKKKKIPSKITQPDCCICRDCNLRNKLGKQSKVEEQLKEVHERVESDREEKKKPDKSAKKWSCCTKKPSKVTQSECCVCSDRDLRNNLGEQSKVEQRTITMRTKIVEEQFKEAQERVEPGGSQLSEDDYDEQEKKKKKIPSMITQPDCCICRDCNLRNKLGKQSKVEEQLKREKKKQDKSAKKWSCCTKKPSKVTQSECCVCSDRDLRNNLGEQSKVERAVNKTQTKIVEEQFKETKERVDLGGSQLSEDDYDEQESKVTDKFVEKPRKLTQLESCTCPDCNLHSKVGVQSKVEEQLKWVHERVESDREEKKKPDKSAKKWTCCAKKPSKVTQSECCVCSDHDLRNKLGEQSKVEEQLKEVHERVESDSEEKKKPDKSAKKWSCCAKKPSKFTQSECCVCSDHDLRNKLGVQSKVEEQLKEVHERVESDSEEKKKPDKSAKKWSCCAKKPSKVTQSECCVCSDHDLRNKLGEQSKVEQATIIKRTKIVEEQLEEAQERVEPGGSQVSQRSAPMVASQVVLLSDQTAGIVPVGQYGPHSVCHAGCQCKSRARRKRKVRQRMIGPQVLQPVNGLFADGRSQQMVEQQKGTISGDAKLFYFITPQWDEQTDDESSARERDGSTSSRESRRKRKLRRRSRRRNRRRFSERGHQRDGSSSRQQMSQPDDKESEQFFAGECDSSVDSGDFTDKCRADVNSGRITKRSLNSPIVEEQLSEWNMQTDQEYFAGEGDSSTSSRESRCKKKAKRGQLTDDEETPGRGLQSKGQHTADAEDDEQFSVGDCSSSKDSRHEWKASGSRNRVGNEVSDLEPAILDEGLSVHRINLANMSTVEQFAGESSSSVSSRDSGRKRKARRKGRRDSSSQCTDEEEMSKRDLSPMVQFAAPQMPGHSNRISGHQKSGSSVLKAEQQMGEKFFGGERDSSDDSYDSRDQRRRVRSTRSVQGFSAQEVSELDIISDERLVNVQQMQQPNKSTVEAQKSQSAMRRGEQNALFSGTRDSSSGSKDSRNIWKTKRKARSRSSVQFADEQPMSARSQKSVEFTEPEILGTNSAVGRLLGNARQMPKSSVSLVEPQTSWQMGEQFSSGRRRSSTDLGRKSKVRAKRKARSGSSGSIKGGKNSAARSMAIDDQLESNTSLTEQFVSNLQMIPPKVAIDKKLTDERSAPKAEKATSWLDETLVGVTAKGEQFADEEKPLTESSKKPTDQKNNNVEESSATLRQLKYRQQLSPSPLQTDDQFTGSRYGIVDCRSDCFGDQARLRLEEFQNVGRADNGQQSCMQTAQSAGQLTYRRPTPTPTQKRTTDQNIQAEDPLFDQVSDESKRYEQADRSAGHTPWLKDIHPKSTWRAPPIDRFTRVAKQRTVGEVRDIPPMSTLKVLTDAQFRDRQKISGPYMHTEDRFVPQPEPRIRFVDEDPFEKETSSQSIRTGRQLTAKSPMPLSYEQTSQQRIKRQQMSGSDGYRADRPLRQGPQYKVGQFKVKLRKPSKGTPTTDEQRTDRWTTSRTRGGKETEPIERHQMPGTSKQRGERLEQQQRGTIASKSNDARRRKSKRTLKMTGIRVYRKPKSHKDSECGAEDFDVDP